MKPRSGFQRFTARDERGEVRAAVGEAAWSLFLAERELSRLRGELAHAQGSQAGLREEVVELVAEVRAAEEGPRSVVVLTRHGEIHSVHADPDAAQAEAERHGAPAGPWPSTPPGVPLADSSWRVTPTLVNTTGPDVHDDAPDVHGALSRVHGAGRAGVGGGRRG